MPDDDLIAAVARLAARERAATVDLLVHLAEMDHRRLHLALGFRSLVAYAIEVLRMSEDAAYNRVQAARAGRQYPRILELIDSGLLSVTTVRMLSKHLTPQNAPRLIAAATGQTRRQVEELMARELPQPDVPSSVRKLPGPGLPQDALAVPSAPPPALVPDVASPPALAGQKTPLIPAAQATPARPVQRSEVSPLSPERYKIAFTVDRSTREKLRRAQDLLRHAIADGDIATIFDRAITLLLEDLARTKYAATARPRAAHRPARTDSRHIPAEVQRAVWERDGGCCAFVGRDGRRCASRSWLEYHHLIPYEEGGLATIENIQLRCRAHNQYEAWARSGAVKELPPPATDPERRPSSPLTPVSRPLDTGSGHGSLPQIIV